MAMSNLEFHHPLLKLLGLIAVVGTIYGAFKDDIKSWFGYTPSAQIIDFSAEPSIVSVGGKTNLKWKTKYATNCTLEWQEYPLPQSASVPVNHGSWLLPFPPKSMPPAKNTDQRLLRLTCHGPGGSDWKNTTVIVEDLADLPSGSGYIPILKVTDWLDCGNGFTDEQKQMRLRMLGRSRTIFKKMVLDVAANNSSAYVTPDPEPSLGILYSGSESRVGPANITFSRKTKVTMRRALDTIQLRPGIPSFFDCKLGDYCHDGFFFSDDLAFDDCIIVPE